MSDMYYFGVGQGCVSKAESRRRRKAAKKHGATYSEVSGNSGHCVCGYGCRLDCCSVKKFWFGTTNYGEPNNSQIQQAVEAELDA